MNVVKVAWFALVFGVVALNQYALHTTRELTTLAKMNSDWLLRQQTEIFILEGRIKHLETITDSNTVKMPSHLSSTIFLPAVRTTYNCESASTPLKLRVR